MKFLLVFIFYFIFVLGLIRNFFCFSFFVAGVLGIGT